jgi:hypothetical protein
VRDKTCEDLVILRSEKSEAESSKKARVLGNEDLERGGEWERGSGYSVCFCVLKQNNKDLEEGTRGQEDKRSLREAGSVKNFI